MIIATIADGYHEDYAKSVGRIAEKYITDLGLNIDEIVEIINGDKRLGIILRPKEEIIENSRSKSKFPHTERRHPKDKNEVILHLNGFLRAHLNIGIGQKVRIDKLTCPEAEKVIISPSSVEDKPKIYIDFLMNRPVVRGQILELQNKLGYDLRVGILSTTPPGIVFIGENTDVRITHEPARELIEDSDIITWDDIGGTKEALARLRTLVEYPLRYPEVFQMLDIDTPHGILLTGPPGIGKTYLSKAIACESGVTRFFVMAPEYVKGWWNTEQEIEKYFKHIKNYEPAVLIIDQIEVLAPYPGSNISDLEKRLTDQLIKSFDKHITNSKIIVIGTTQNASNLNPSLRVYGRFDVELNLQVPNATDRYEILSIQTRGIPLRDVSLHEIAETTGGFTPADLELLVKEAGMRALERENLLNLDFETQIDDLVRTSYPKIEISQDDFLIALSSIKPSASREITFQIPDVRWDDIGGLEEVKQSLKEMIEWPIKYPEIFTQMGIRSPRGVLLYGPPGTGKTLLAKALANEIQANFIVVKGPELLSKWFSESARLIRDLFKRARQLAPCIVFFDEIDAIATHRGGSFPSEGSRERDRIINQLLASLDGVEKLNGVFVVSATNRPDTIDPALLRPGRLDRLIYVPVPDDIGRLKILEVHTRRMNLEKNVDLNALAFKTENYTGADIENLCREAAFAALRKNPSIRSVSMMDFEEALDICRPSVNRDVIDYYRVQEELMKKKRTIEYSYFKEEFG
ncbi:AAA family ATPase [Candidatus Hodarchaeum mangrovi]